jgi:hypothetical protein
LTRLAAFAFSVLTSQKGEMMRLDRHSIGEKEYTLTDRIYMFGVRLADRL